MLPTIKRLLKAIPGLQKGYYSLKDIIQCTNLIILTKPINALPNKPENYRIVHYNYYTNEIANHYQRLDANDISQERIRNRFNNELHYFLLVQEDKIVANTWIADKGRFIDELGLYARLPSNSIWIRDIRVNPEYRGRGIFATFIDLIICQNFPDTKIVFSDVDSKNKASLRAHKKHGFRELGCLKALYLLNILLIRMIRTGKLIEFSGYKTTSKIVITGNEYNKYIRKNIA